MMSPGDRADAIVLCEQAIELQIHGRLQDAVAAYRRSLALCPMAETHVGLGWALAALGYLDEAIAECERAIALDPELGNPYHDIGTYLRQKGEPDAAIPWLERAKHAPRFGTRHAPYVSLGEIFAAKGMLGRALAEFSAALALAPGDVVARHGVRAISRRLH